MDTFLEASLSVWSPTSTAATPLQPSKPTVKLHFVCNTIHRFMALDDETQSITPSQPVVVFRDPNRFDSIIKVDRSTLLSHHSTVTFHEIIHSKLFEYRHRLHRWSGLGSLVSHIIRSVRSRLSHTNRVRVHVDFLKYHIFYDNILFRDLMQRFFDEGNYGMKPASKSARMEMLKRVDFDKKQQIHSDDDEEERCTVCLEELGKEEVLCMPCSHRFHGQCIIKWLDNSHYCPICRFQMPTQ